MRFALALLLLALPWPAAAQTRWGSTSLDASAYPVSAAFDGDAVNTFYEGQCRATDAPGLCTTPVTVTSYVLGSTWTSAQTVTNVAARFASTAHTPTSAVVEGSNDAQEPNADGSNLTNWTALATLPPGQDVSVSVSGGYRHVRLRMTPGPGNGCCGGTLFPAAVSNLVFTTMGPPSPPSSDGCPGLYASLARQKVIAHGDSITAGSGSMLAYPALLSAWTVTANDNFGVSGDRTDMMLARMGSVLAASGNVVILFGGTNDVQLGYATSTSIANLDAMVSQTRSAGKTPVLVTPLPRNNVSAPGLLVLRAAIQDLGAAKCVRVVDLWGVFETPGTANQLSPQMTSDGVHPNTYGSLLLARGIARALGWAWGGD